MMETRTDERVQGLEVWGKADHKMMWEFGGRVDCGGDCVTLCICQKWQNCALKKVSFTLCK